MRRGLLAATAALGLAVPAGVFAGRDATVPTAPITSAALAPADLNGAKPSEEGFTRAAFAVAQYERDFESLTYGRSRLLYVESTVTLYSSTTDASLALAGMRAAFNPTSSSFKNAVTATFAQYTGMSSRFSIRQSKTIERDDLDGTVYLLRLSAPVSRMDGGYVFLQTGRLVGQLIAVSKPGESIAPADLAGLYGAFTKRLQATAKRL
jgi:hypothetical protein